MRKRKGKYIYYLNIFHYKGIVKNVHFWVICPNLFYDFIFMHHIILSRMCKIQIRIYIQTTAVSTKLKNCRSKIKCLWLRRFTSLLIWLSSRLMTDKNRTTCWTVIDEFSLLDLTHAQPGCELCSSHHLLTLVNSDNTVVKQVWSVFWLFI